MKVNPEVELAAKLMEINVSITERRNAYQVAFDAGKLMSLARAHRRLADVACGRELTQREVQREENIQMDILAILAHYNLYPAEVKFSGDPRGYTVKIHFPDGRGNTLGGDSEGWGI